MNIGVKVEGLEQVIQSMRDLTKRQKPLVNLVVGYSAPYSLRVHEDLMMRHPRGGQAKFLEQPMRENKGNITDLITDIIRNTNKTMEEALIIGGDYLLSLSRPLVPVDTGFLRDSGFVRVDRT